MSLVDERVQAGMRDQLTQRDARLATGARQIGWKLGFGSPAALTTFGLDRPLVGYLLAEGLVPDGGDVAINDWAQPMLEPEIAVHLSQDIDPEGGWDQARSAIAGLSAAIELADLHPQPHDVRAILAGDIFHRHVILGPVHAGVTSVHGVRVSVLVDGQRVAVTDSPTDLTGETVELVRLTAQSLAECGERVRAGDVVITGSVVPPLPVRPGTQVSTRTTGLGVLSVTLT